MRDLNIVSHKGKLDYSTSSHHLSKSSSSSVKPTAVSAADKATQKKSGSKEDYRKRSNSTKASYNSRQSGSNFLGNTRQALFSDKSEYSGRADSASKTVVHKIEITWKSIFMVLITLAGLYLGLRLLSIVSVFLLGFIFSAVLLPFVRKLMRRGLGKSLSILIVYVVVLAVFTGLLVMVILPIGKEVSEISHEFPAMKTQLVNDISGIIASVTDIDKDAVSKSISEYGDRLFRGQLFINSGGAGAATFQTISDLGAVIGTIFLSVVLSIYMIAEHDSFLDIVFLRINDPNKRSLAKNLLHDVENKLGQWVLGQGALSLIVGVVVWIILELFGVPFALPLALLAAFAELIPSGGPVISFIPAVAVALVSNGVVNGLFVSLAYFIFYQFENGLIVPKIMGNVIGVKPVVVFVGLLVGLSVGGVWGAVAAVPSMVLLKIGYDFYVSYRKLEAEAEV